MNNSNGNGTGRLKKWIYGAIGAFAFLMLLFTAPMIFETVDANEICVIQAPWTGTLSTYSNAGTVWQWYGKVTKYKKSYQYWFSAPNYVPEDIRTNEDRSIKVSFNDRGHAQLSGSIRIDMPTDVVSIQALHVKYGSQDAIEQALVGQLITKSVYMTGPMMSSKESNSEKRNLLIEYIEDQAINGVYSTVTTTAKVKDPMDEHQERTVSIVEVRRDEKGQPVRVEKSPVKEFNIRLYNLTISSLDYDPEVEKQFNEQQKLTMQVQTAIAEAKTAEQRRFTVEQQGIANAAKAKWEQEVIKAQQVTEAEQRKEVARLNADAEQENKRANILKGEGESAYKRLVTQANNNLELKLEAWKFAEAKKWDAFAQFKGSLVPAYQSGNTSGGNTNAVNWLEIMGMKAARDLDLDLNVKNK